MAVLDLRDSYRACVDLSRRTGKNFYYSFWTLPRSMAEEMCVLYAFMRRTDDLADAEEIPAELRAVALAQWSNQLHEAIHALTAPRPALSPTIWQAVDEPLSPVSSRELDRQVLHATADLVVRRNIPPQLLDDVIGGVTSDLTPRVIATFAELEQYCYQVAGAVGLSCIHIWGFEGERARQMAIDCGTAFQLTNILRDLAEDVGNGRVYLPAEDLERFGYTREQLARGEQTPAFHALMRFQVARAHEYYDRSAGLSDCLSVAGRRILAAMREIYGGLLREIERRDYDVFSSRVQLSRLRKLKAAFLARFRQ